MSTETEVEPDEIEEGCGYSWDHTIPEGAIVCTECGAEFWDLDEEEG